MIVYTPLWETMKKKGVSTYALINKYGMILIRDQCIDQY